METIQPTDGGITEITAAENNVDIQNLARFAVHEYNKNENIALEFVKVISAKKQDVAGSGTIYYITLEAKDGDTTNKYDTQVLVKELLNSKELLQFTQVTIVACCYCHASAT